jgi:hypothetical protein
LIFYEKKDVCAAALCMSSLMATAPAATKDFFAGHVVTASHFIILKTSGTERKGLLYYGLPRAIQSGS